MAFHDDMAGGGGMVPRSSAAPRRARQFVNHPMLNELIEDVLCLAFALGVAYFVGNFAPSWNWIPWDVAGKKDAAFGLLCGYIAMLIFADIKNNYDWIRYSAYAFAGLAVFSTFGKGLC